MASIKLGGLAAVIAIVGGGLVVAWAKGWNYLTGIEAVAVLFAGVFIGILVAVFLPIGNMALKGIAMLAVFALIVFWGLSAIGVM